MNKPITISPFIRSAIAIGMTIILCCLQETLAQDFKSEKELQKAAESYFKSENYIGAFPLFSQLLSLYPSDANYNYKFSVCMLFADNDKMKALEFLIATAKNPRSDKKVHYYLGVCRHLNYQFPEAIKAYKKFKNLAGEKEARKLGVNRKIEMCGNGLSLLKDNIELEILNKTEIMEEEYFRSYEMDFFGGKLLVKPDDFKTKADKSRKESSIMYLGQGANELLYSSYGEAGENKDIFRVIRRIDGSWSQPVPLSDMINTEFDEDYPVMRPNTNTLYFCSKGHNSMGGYDVFKSIYDEKNDTWSKPVNLDFAINSTADDILYIATDDEKTAYFSSNRSTKIGLINVYSVKLNKVPGVAPVVPIAQKEDQPTFEVYTGEFDTTGLAAEQLALELIEESAELYTAAPEEEIAEKEQESKQTKEQSELNQPTSDNLTTLSDEELVSKAKEYAKKVSEDQKTISKEAETAFLLASEKKSQSERVLKEAEDLFSTIDDIQDEDQKEQALSKANQLKTESEKSEKEAEVAFEMSKTLASEADAKSKKAAIAADNATKIEQGIQSGNKDESIAILIEQKVMAEQDEPEGAIQISNEKEEAAKDRESLASESFEKIQFMESEISEIGQDIDRMEKQADDTDDETLKLELLRQAEELKAERNATKQELEVTYDQAEVYEKEAEKLREEADVFTKIATDVSSSAGVLISDKTTSSEKLEPVTTDAQSSFEEWVTPVEEEQFLYQNEIVSYTEQINVLKEQGVDASILEDQLNTLNALEASVNEAKKNKDRNLTTQRLAVLKEAVESFNQEVQLLASKTEEGKTKDSVKEMAQLTMKMETYQNESSSLAAEIKELETKGYDIKFMNTLIENISRLENEIQASLTIKDTKTATLKTEELQTALLTANEELTTLAAQEPTEVEMALGKEEATVSETDKLEEELSGLSKEMESYQIESSSLSDEIKELEEKGYDVTSLNTSIESINRLEGEIQTAIVSKDTETATTKSVELKTILVAANEEMNNLSSQKPAREVAITDSVAKPMEQIYTEYRIYQVSVTSIGNTVKRLKNSGYAVNDLDEKLVTISATEDELETALSANDQEKAKTVIFELNSLITQLEEEIKKVKEQEITVSTNTPKEISIADDFEENSRNLAASNLDKRYTSKEDIATVDSITTLAEELFVKAEDQKAKANNIADEKERATALKVAVEMEKAAKEKQEEGIVQYNFRVNQEQLVQEGFQNHLLGSEDLTSINSLKSESNALFDEAQEARINAVEIQDPVEREEELLKAKAIEKQAIQKQKSTINIYTYQKNQAILAEAASDNAFMSSDQRNKLQTMQDELNTLLTESEEIRKNAEVLEDPVKKADELEKANQVETNALSKQKEAMAIFNLGDEELEVEMAMTEEFSPTEPEKALLDMEKSSSEPITQMQTDTTGDTRVNEEETIMAEPSLATENTVLEPAIGTNEEPPEIIGEMEMTDAQAMYEQLDTISDPDKMIEVLAMAEKLEKEAAEAAVQKETEIVVMEAEEVAEKEAEIAAEEKAAEKEAEIAAMETAKEKAAEKEAEIAAMETAEEKAAEKEAEIAAMETAKEKAAEKEAEIAAMETAEEKAAEKEAEIAAKKAAEVAVAEKREEEIAAKEAAKAPITATKGADDYSLPLQTMPLSLDVINITSFSGNTRKSNNTTYSTSNPIPLNTAIPTGLVYKVQIGAFRNPIRQDLFNGINPIMGENTPMGFIRYTAGMFQLLGSATKTRDAIRKMGYKDAFVVAFYNGKRVSHSKASTMIASGKIKVPSGPPGITNSRDIIYSVQVGVYKQPSDIGKRFGLTNLYTNTTSNGLIKYLYGTHRSYAEAVGAKDVAVNKGINDAFIVAFQNGERIGLSGAIKITGIGGSVRASSDIGQTNELFSSVKTAEFNQLIYTVQVGVYLKPTDLEEKYGLKDIYTQTGEGGSIKYCYGKFSSYKEAANSKLIPVQKGITDAFVTAYYNGKRITIAQAKTIESTSGDKLLKEKQEKTISGVTKEFYTVKIGEYENDIPIDEAKAFFDIKELGIDRILQEATAIYTVGNFETLEEANEMQKELIAKGQLDAIVVVNQGGKILSVKEFNK